MVNILNMENNENIVVSDEKENFQVIEYKFSYDAKNKEEAVNNYFLSRSKYLKKQLLITLNNSSVCINAKSMIYMAGDIKIKTNVKNVGDLIGKTLSGKFTGEDSMKPRYIGNGYLMLQHTYKHIILEEMQEDVGIVVSDGMFLACSEIVNIKSISRATISSATLGKEGMFNLMLKGRGVCAFLSPVPKNELTIIELKNDTLRIDGNYAIAWSDTLNFTVESTPSSILGTTVSKEWVVNVYRGTGYVWLAPIEYFGTIN